MQVNDIYGRFESIGPIAQMAVLVAAIGFLLFESAGDVRVSVIFDDVYAKLSDLWARAVVATIFGIHFMMFTTWFLLAGIPVSFRLLADWGKDSGERLPDSPAPRTMNPSGSTPKDSD